MKAKTSVQPKHVGLGAQPVNNVRWVDRHELTANSYNPNIVAPPELELLKMSLLEDGWTQPIVAVRRAPFPCGAFGVIVRPWTDGFWVTRQDSLMEKVRSGGPASTPAHVSASPSVKERGTEDGNSLRGSKTSGESVGSDSSEHPTETHGSGISTESTMSASSSEAVCPICMSSANEQLELLPSWTVEGQGDHEESGLPKRMRCFGPGGESETASLPVPSADPRKLFDSDGQPSVSRVSLQAGSEVVDGFHRWTIAEDPDIAAMTGGMVPVVYLEDIDPAHQMASTIRHNRARGVHVVLKMADLVHTLIELGMSRRLIEERLGMEQEEIDRLYDRGNMLKRGSGLDFNLGWQPDPDA